MQQTACTLHIITFGKLCMKAFLKVMLNFALCLISDDYEAARKHLERAIYVSDLQTEAEDDTSGGQGHMSQKRTKRLLIISLISFAIFSMNVKHSIFSF